MLTVFAFILGAILGAGLSIIIDRLSMDHPKWSPLNRCSSCGKTLTITNAIPIVSFIIRRGKCQYCGDSIPVREIGMELLIGLLWVWTMTAVGGWSGILLGLWGMCSVTMAMVDFRKQTIPIGLIIFGTVTLTILTIIEFATWRRIVWGMGVGGILPGIIFGGTFVIMKQAVFGMGDVLIGLLLGLWLGPVNVALALIIASIIGLMFWIGQWGVQSLNGVTRISFVPGMLVGGWGIYFLSFYHLEWLDFILFGS